jgi:hypothetical protein
MAMHKLALRNPVNQSRLKGAGADTLLREIIAAPNCAGDAAYKARKALAEVEKAPSAGTTDRAPPATQCPSLAVPHSVYVSTRPRPRHTLVLLLLLLLHLLLLLLLLLLGCPRVQAAAGLAAAHAVAPG